jgi:hypothetical protein
MISRAAFELKHLIDLAARNAGVPIGRTRTRTCGPACKTKIRRQSPRLQLHVRDDAYAALAEVRQRSADPQSCELYFRPLLASPDEQLC